ncbi:MAG: mRNA splicing protein [Alyxoria varia]|nr:MAG: mRNA splicing protein [Alyxoria varia]
MPPPPTSRPPKPTESTGAASKERNEYIPNFISKKPFYVADSNDTAPDSAATGANSLSTGDYLEHQRLQSDQQSRSDPLSKWYDRGRKAGPAATKFRKGACENCGAMTHKKKDCLSRPRKQGAKWTGRDIEADELVEDVQLGWDAKRDRWNGYDASEYRNVIEEFNALEEMKKKINKDKDGGDKKLIGNGEGDDDDDADEDGEGGKGANGTKDDEEGARYEEETDMGRHQSTSTRNLRLREDTAKYLLNLDLDSARYDPKTRTMVDSGATADNAAALVAEEGFMKASGDAAEFDAASRAAWESQERGDRNKTHLQANPTSGEYFRKKESEQKKQQQEEQRKQLLEKYGNQESFQRDEKTIPKITESERFVEYDEKGKVKGLEPVKTKSSYVEDVEINNHTSVWGSWWRNFMWGYACCHSTTKNSYCTGEEGKQALEDEERKFDEVNDDVDGEEEVPRRVAWREEQRNEEHVPNGVDDDGKAKADAAAKKRTLHEIEGVVTEEQMDEYKRRKMNKDDPMAAMLGKDELVG